MNYLEFQTEVVVNFRNYEINGSLESSPGISFCKEKILLNSEKVILLKSSKGGADLELFFNNCKYNDSSEADCGINYSEFSEKLNEQKLMSDYLKVIDLKLDKKFCWFLHKTKKTIRDPKCNNIEVISHNRDLKCYTVFSKLNEKFDNNLTDLSDINRAYFELYDQYILYIHDSNQLPTFFNSKLVPIAIKGSYLIYKYKKTLFERLPPPYKTNCQYYRGKIRSQSQCINELLFQEFLNYECLPKSITYVINKNDYSKLKRKICGNSTLEIRNAFFKKLNHRCHDPCLEELYEFWEQENDFIGWLKLFLKFKSKTEHFFAV
jgi:hypothetical protein